MPNDSTFEAPAMLSEPIIIGTLYFDEGKGQMNFKEEDGTVRFEMIFVDQGHNRKLVGILGDKGFCLAFQPTITKERTHQDILNQLVRLGILATEA